MANNPYTILLDSGHKHSPLTLDALRYLNDELDSSGDREVTLVLPNGCSGMHLGELASSLDRADEMLSLLTRAQTILMSKLSVTVLGPNARYLLGGGLELALATDKIESDTPSLVKVGFPEVTLGLFPGADGEVLLKLRLAQRGVSWDVASETASSMVSSGKYRLLSDVSVNFLMGDIRVRRNHPVYLGIDHIGFMNLLKDQKEIL